MLSLLGMVCIVLSFQCDKVLGSVQLACKPCRCCLGSILPSCVFSEICNFGCRNGYWGDRCVNGCSDNCKSCSSNDSCSICKDGYYNGQNNDNWNGNCSLRCNSRCKSCISFKHCTDCVDGYHGSSCQFNCSLGCFENACNQTDGNCKCASSSYWGDSCEYSCSDGCLSLACWQDSGKCVNGCKVGYGGERCETCDSGFSKIDDRCTNCSNTCAICSGRLCLKCKDTYGGIACQTVCPERCRSCLSDKICTECLDGYFDQTCSSTCLKGKWGNKCSRICPANCLNGDCHHSNGSCTLGCKKGHKGDFCDNNCSNSCRDSLCSWLTGDCIKGCRENHWGKQCEHVCSDNCNPVVGATSCSESTGLCSAGCIEGHYSVQCNKTCSVNCLNASCDISGKCIHGCSGEFMDDSCLQVKYRAGEKSHVDAATIGGSMGGAMVVTVIVIVAAVVLYKRRRGSEQNIKGNHGNSTVVYSNIENRPQNSATETSTAEGISAAYEMIARREDDSAEYSALSSDTNQSAAFLDIGSRSSEHVANQPIQTIYEKPMLEEDMREYAALEYNTSQTSDENLHGNRNKIQNQSLTLGKGTARRDSADNIINTGACSSDEKTIRVREEEHAEYINTNLSGVSQAKKYS